MNDTLFFKDDIRWREDSPMSHMVKAGDFLWLSGIVSLDEKRKVVGAGDIKAQTRQIFTIMRRVLGLAGCDLTSVIRLTNYLTVSFDDMEQTNRYWEVRREFFGAHRPASTGVKVSALIYPELLIEIDAVAYAPHAVINSSALISSTKA
jgi:2-iminobutanoate/2-iminopropanoate deaminase